MSNATPKANGSPLTPRGGRWATLLSALVLGLLTCIATFDERVLEVYSMGYAVKPSDKAEANIAAPKMTGGEVRVVVFDNRVIEDRVAENDDSSNKVTFWSWTVRACFFAVGFLLGIPVGWCVQLATRKLGISLGQWLFAGLIAGAFTEILMIEVKIAEGAVRPDREELYSLNCLAMILCGFAGSLAVGLVGLRKDPLVGCFSGFIAGFLLQRVLLQFTSGISGLVDGDITPLIVIIGGPVVGAFVGAVIADRLRKRSRQTRVAAGNPQIGTSPPVPANNGTPT